MRCPHGAQLRRSPLSRTPSQGWHTPTFTINVVTAPVLLPWHPSAARCAQLAPAEIQNAIAALQSHPVSRCILVSKDTSWNSRWPYRFKLRSTGGSFVRLAQAAYQINTYHATCLLISVPSLCFPQSPTAQPTNMSCPYATPPQLTEQGHAAI